MDGVVSATESCTVSIDLGGMDGRVTLVGTGPNQLQNRRYRDDGEIVFNAIDPDHGYVLDDVHTICLPNRYSIVLLVPHRGGHRVRTSR